MKKRVQLELEMSEKRERLNAILSTADNEVTDEMRAEMSTLTKRLQEIEPELRAAIVADITAPGPNDSESREKRTLEQRCSLGTFMDAIFEQRALEGAEAELATQLKLEPGMIPVAMLRDRNEHRAVTPAPAEVGTDQMPIIDAVFPQAAASFLNISQPTVGVGQKLWPITATSATVHTPAENAPAANTTGSFSAEAVEGRRMQASFFFSEESKGKFAGMEDALRRNLSAALSDSLDRQIIAGNDGLLVDGVLDAHDAAKQTDYATYRNALGYGRVDGTWAGSISDIRLLMGAPTYGHSSAQFRSNNAGDRAALEDLMQVTGGVRVSAHVPPVANKKQNALVRLGSRMDAVAPIWEGIRIIPDELTLLDEGQIKITAIMLYNFQLLRAGGFWKQAVQVAA